MPVMDGLEATKRLRQHETKNGLEINKRQIIIGISANSHESIEKDALVAGMNNFIPVRVCLSINDIIT
jgi:CheY-like chemotaxis protein